MLNDAQQELLSYLEMVRDFRKGHTGGELPPGLAYFGKEDFLLKHGKWYELPETLPKLDWALPKYCYANSIEIGARRGFPYIEGVALNIIPVDHAWNLTPDGKVADATWKNEGRAYFGVELPLDYAFDRVYKNGSACLDDWGHRHPLLRKPWEPMAMQMTLKSLRRKINAYQ